MKCPSLSRPAWTWQLAGLLLLVAGSGEGAPAAWPERPAGAPGGSEVAGIVTDLGLEAREAVLRREILSGNVPNYLRSFAEGTVRSGAESVILQGDGVPVLRGSGVPGVDPPRRGMSAPVL